MPNFSSLFPHGDPGTSLDLQNVSEASGVNFEAISGIQRALVDDLLPPLLAIQRGIARLAEIATGILQDTIGQRIMAMFNAEHFDNNLQQILAKIGEVIEIFR